MTHHTKSAQLSQRQALRVLTLFAPCLLGGVGCGHAREATPPAAATAAPVPEPAQTAPHAEHADQVERADDVEGHAPAEATASESTAEPSEEQPSTGETAEGPAAQPKVGEPIQSFMLEHFLITAWARDSIVDGNLEDIRAPLLALATYEYESVAPGGWMKGIAQLQAAALLTAQAQTVPAAAAGLAAMARVCGDCHREQGGPEVQRYKPERETPKSDRLDVRMYRHAWAAERLWEGLTAPSDNAWMAGAAALAHAPTAAPKTRPALPPKVVAGLDRVRALGARAADADTSERRAELYGQLLSTCADCHRQQAKIDF